MFVNLSHFDFSITFKLKGGFLEGNEQFQKWKFRFNNEKTYLTYTLTSSLYQTDTKQNQWGSEAFNHKNTKWKERQNSPLNEIQNITKTVQNKESFSLNQSLSAHTRSTAPFYYFCNDWIVPGFCSASVIHTHPFLLVTYKLWFTLTSLFIYLFSTMIVCPQQRKLFFFLSFVFVRLFFLFCLFSLLFTWISI